MLDHKSCEMMADDLQEFLSATYGDNRSTIIEISEDGENGAKRFYPSK